MIAEAFLIENRRLTCFSSSNHLIWRPTGLHDGLLVVVTTFLPALPPLAKNQGYQHQRRERIRPTPAEEGVEHETGQRRKRQSRTRDGLVGVGPHSSAPKLPCRFQLCPPEEGHHRQRNRGQDDSDRALLGGLAESEKAASCSNENEDGQGDQQRSGNS